MKIMSAYMYIFFQGLAGEKKNPPSLTTFLDAVKAETCIYFMSGFMNVSHSHALY